MQTVKLSMLVLLCTCVVLINGCGPELQDLKIQNDTQRKRIAELESQLQATRLNLEQLKRQLNTAGSISGVEAEALRQKIAALEEDMGRKKALIATMQQQLLYGGTALPVELSTLLEDFVKDKEMVSYDSSRGIVKFQSDLLFEPGSDSVTDAAAQTVKSLCEILNSPQAEGFDIIIAGHTDDMRIAKPATIQKHPTNWHLSAHRAISVLNIMVADKVVPERLSIRGFGEFRPVEANKPDKKGNPQNRRVEIYIVPKGA